MKKEALGLPDPHRKSFRNSGEVGVNQGPLTKYLLSDLNTFVFIQLIVIEYLCTEAPQGKDDELRPQLTQENS